jgi:hypothetical protein
MPHDDLAVSKLCLVVIEDVSLGHVVFGLAVEDKLMAPGIEMVLRDLLGQIILDVVLIEGIGIAEEAVQLAAQLLELLVVI